MSATTNKCPAVVVGMCAHGLATVRALAGEGVPVFSLDPDRSLPGTATRMAKVAALGPINGTGLTDTLLALAERERWPEKPVLFVMNDNMVREVATHWPRLQLHYQLSWADSAGEVLRLSNKDSLPDACRRGGVKFPATTTIVGENDSGIDSKIKFPAVVKPTVPMGAFKAIVVNEATAVRELARKYPQSLPFVVQDWIPGKPTSLKFAALFLDHGKLVARFEGRKGFAGKDGMGQGTVMEPYQDDRVHEVAWRFVDGLGLTGPVAIEFKEDQAGNLWMIEPNVGRTEYCVDVCIANGVNFPYIEYCAVVGNSIPKPNPRNARIWFDTDRDPVSWVRHIFAHGVSRAALTPVFPYLRLADLNPFFAIVARNIRARARRIFGF